jgi:hypothetical protein
MQGNECVAAPAPPAVQCGPGTQLVAGTDGGECLPVQPEAGVDSSAPPRMDGGVEAGADDASMDAGDLSPWSTNVRVNSASMPWASEPQIAIDSQGRLFVACMSADSRGLGVSLYRSTTGGGSFDLLVTHFPTSANGFFGDTTVAVDPADHVYWAFVEYVQQDANTITSQVVASISSDGNTFPDPVPVRTQDPMYPFDDRPWLSPGRDGTMYLSWTNGSSNVTATTATLGAVYATSTNGGSFGAEQIIIDPATTYTYEESPLAFDQTGAACVAGITWNATMAIDDVDLYHPGGSDAHSWASREVSPVVTERHFPFETFPIVTSDTNGDLAIVFLNAFSRDITPYFTRSTDNGQTWSPRVKVSDFTGASTAALPWITTDEKNRAHVLWLDDRTGAWVPYTAMSADGMTFGPPERIGDMPFTEDGTSLTSIGDFNDLVVRNGWRYAVWTDTRSGESQVYFSKAPEPR